MKRWIALSCLLLAACNAAAKDAVKLKLTDPESAQFEDVASKGSVTCGLVNAKNHLGGYSGQQGFLYENSVARMETDKGAAFIHEFSQKCPPALVTKWLAISIERQSRELKRTM